MHIVLKIISTSFCSLAFIAVFMDCYLYCYTNYKQYKKGKKQQSRTKVIRSIISFVANILTLIVLYYAAMDSIYYLILLLHIYFAVYFLFGNLILPIAFSNKYYKLSNVVIRILNYIKINSD